MLFNSFSFFLFFPVVTFIFFVIPGRFRGVFLLLASCVFYAAYIPAYLGILFLLIAIDYIAGIAIEKAPNEKQKSCFLTLSVIANLGLLFSFKYYNFFADTIHDLFAWTGANINLPHSTWLLPIGLSFHTFQSMSYTIEVRTGRQPAERNFLTYALYVMFFPQLVAGPIERPQHLLPQLKCLSGFKRDNVVSGLQLMLWGFIKKMCIADRLGPLVDPFYQHPELHSGFGMMLATVCFAVQVYCDFSGYTDIARGCAQVLGVNLAENFKRPYFSSSIVEFWQRWHISLTTWFRDYLFYPLRLVLPEKYLVYTATMVVFILCGMWHGASWSFAVFGLLHGAAMCLSIYWRKHVSIKLPSSHPVLQRRCYAVLTFSFVCFTLVFFRATDLHSAMAIVASMATSIGNLAQGGPYLSLEDFTLLRAHVNSFFWGAVLTPLFFFLEYMQDTWSLRTHADKYSPGLRLALYATGAYVIVLLGVFGARQFIYFQF